MNLTAIAASPDTVSRVVGHGSSAFEAARDRLNSLRKVANPGLWLPETITFEPDGNVLASGPRAPGVDLASLLRIRAGLTVEECVAVGIDVANAVAALHSADLVHGDLSPANVVVTPRRVVLVDLVGGIRRAERGTPGYSAPERAVGATPASDVYSLGRLLSHAASDEAQVRIDAWVAPLIAPVAAHRPTAAEAAIALRACATPVPVSVPDVGVAAAVRARARSAEEVTLKTAAGRPWRVKRALKRSVVIAGVAALATGILVTVVAVTSAFLPDPVPNYLPTYPISANCIAAPPAEAARELTIQRFEAIGVGDSNALLATTGEGSEARDADAVLAEGLTSGEIRFDGLGIEVTNTTVIEAVGRTATVHVTYVVSAHNVRDGARDIAVRETTATADLLIAWTRESGWRVERAESVT